MTMPAARIGTACTEAKPASTRGGDEARPSVGFGLEVGDGDRLTGGIAVHARTFVGLQLEQFQFAGLPRRWPRAAELLERVGEQEPGRLDIEQLQRSAR